MQLIINILGLRKPEIFRLLSNSLAYFSLGSNLGDRQHNLDRAREFIVQRIGQPVSVSAVYETVPWGYRSRYFFYNCCMCVRTSLEPLALLEEMLSIERKLGRYRTDEGYRDRTIDIDILFYGDLIMQHPMLTVPHPAIEKRRFVLVPLHEIAPDLVHPGNGMTVGEMLDRCGDLSPVKPV
jgi:2-amino-4-hydroxy-6-hydroxymethyldihydropteridine diphosphokinase